MLLTLLVIGAVVVLGGILGWVFVSVMKNRAKSEPINQVAFDPETQVIKRPSDIRSSVLTVVEGPQTGRVFTPRGVVVSIGRGASNEVNLTDPTVSRNSAKISWTSNGWVLINDDSANPILVDEQEVSKKSSVSLNDGSLIQVGKTRLLFRPIEFKAA